MASCTPCRIRNGGVKSAGRQRCWTTPANYPSKFSQSCWLMMVGTCIKSTRCVVSLLFAFHALWIVAIPFVSAHLNASPFAMRKGREYA